MHAAVGDRELSGTHGVRKPQLYMFKTKTMYTHPSCHCAQTLWMLKNATFGKKKYASLLFKKMCKKCYSFFFLCSCKILQFIVIYKCKLWYQLTFL